MWYAVIKTFISVNLVYAFVELLLEIREIIDDKTYGIKHCPEWYTLGYAFYSTVLLFIIGVVLYVWL